MTDNKQKRYEEEFRASAVKMDIEKGGVISEVSKSLDISEPALRLWVADVKEPEGSENFIIEFRKIISVFREMTPGVQIFTSLPNSIKSVKINSYSW
ncbi:transposase [Clostridium sp. WILCCON 0269]|uniref:Transposase n=1 Tax=Candidatus Clostridium eludens TaxID=3381663 RepID=A0ABW8SUW9_9CLOT